MGQTSSTGQVDYTFGFVANSDDLSNRNKEPKNAFSTWTNERLLRHPQHYGLENNSSTIAYDSDDEFSNGKRLSTPSTSSAYSVPVHPHSYFKSTTSPFQNNDDQDQDEKHTIDRIDSGYADQDVFFGPKKELTTTTTTMNNNRLVQDIHYVDKIYYANSTHHHQQQHELNLFDSTLIALTTDILDSDAKHCDDDGNITIGTKLTFAAAALASQDPTMRDICLSRRSIISLDSNIGLLKSIRKLDLCNNMLTELPDSIGQLKQLEILSISQNRLRYLPDSIQYLPRLTELDVSYNQLDRLPSLSHLTLLSTLLLSHNQLTRLPTNLTGMKRLVTMDLTANPLCVLPAEITRLSNLRRLRLDQCQKLLNTNEQMQIKVDLTHDPPSLVEICARKIVSSLSSSSSSSSSTTTLNSKTRHSSSPAIATKLGQLPGHLLSYFASANICSSCHGPYFESHVTRHRLIEKNDLWIPVEYTLCSAHWSDETDRLLNMFHRETSSFCGDGNMINTIASLHTLSEQHYQQQQQQQQLSPSGSLCMEMDELDTKSIGNMLPFLWRHPQRLQRVRNNKNPSSFLIPKIHRG